MKRSLMKKLVSLSAAGIGLWLLAASAAASTDVFSGIYSVVNPATGGEVDVMKIRPYPGGYGVFSYLGGDEVQRGFTIVVEVAKQEPSQSVRALPLLGEGKLYFVPEGAASPVGRSETGYISDAPVLGKLPLKRRLLPKAPERGINGIHRYVGRTGEIAASIRVLNYSANALQLGISSADNRDNAIDTDPVNGNMASAFNCCFYLPQKWQASLKVNIEIRAHDGKLTMTPMTVPEYEDGDVDQFEVAVNPDGLVEILFNRSDSKRPLPSPPIANR
jgi:hypothetical protein